MTGGFWLVLAATSGSLLPIEAGSLPVVDVYVAGQEGYHTYRIPAMVRTVKGTLLAFCEGRKSSRQDWGDIDILVKRSTDGGRTWSRAILVADFGPDTAGNPAPVVDRRTGVVWLLFTSNPGHLPEKAIQPGLDGPTRTVWVTYSRDDGQTWSPPVNITRMVKHPGWSWYATGPGNGIQLRSGRLVIPCDHVRGPTTVAYACYGYSHVIYSDDGGQSWRLGGSAGPGCNEAAVVELAGGTLMLNMRSYAGRYRRAVSLSRDGGLSWSRVWHDETLVEPVCQASLIRFGRRRPAWLLFSNPASTERRNMTVRWSRDEGKSWAASLTLYAGPSAYSSLVELGRGWAGILYERGAIHPYERIVFSWFRVPWTENMP